MNEPTVVLQCLDELGNGVHVEFSKQGDRFDHKILAKHGCTSVPILKSLGETREQYPIVPIWSELHDQGETLFLTGMTSEAHWSMSVHSDSMSEDNINSRLSSGVNSSTGASNNITKCHYLSFDVACRLKKRLPRLGSLYQAYDADVRVGPHFELKARLVQKQPHSVIIGSLSLEQPRTCNVFSVIPERELLISPELKELPTAFPATIQWKYGVCWSSQGQYFDLSLDGY